MVMPISGDYFMEYISISESEERLKKRESEGCEREGGGQTSNSNIYSLYLKTRDQSGKRDGLILFLSTILNVNFFIRLSIYYVCIQNLSSFRL